MNPSILVFIVSSSLSFQARYRLKFAQGHFLYSLQPRFVSGRGFSAVPFRHFFPNALQRLREPSR
jgi:hypothetical protein